MSSFPLKQAITIANLMNETPIRVSQEQIEELNDSELILESVTLDEVIQSHFEGLAIHRPLMLEAITSKYNRVENVMKAFNRKFKSALDGTGIGSEVAQISKPRKAGGLAVVAASIPTTDGQSVSIIFHSPDNDPAKIVADDTLVAFRFMLNKRDVTHVVAPSGGHDIALNQVVMALSNLVERNSSKFQKAQEGKRAEAEELKTFQDGIEAIEVQKGQLSQDIAKTEKQVNDSVVRGSSIKKLYENQKNKNQALQVQVNEAQKAAELTATSTGGSSNGNYVSEKIVELVNKMTMFDFAQWALSNMSLAENDALALYKQAKEQASENAQLLATENRDEVRENARYMILSEFTDWAKEKLQMKPYDAEVLYKNTNDELKTEHLEKMKNQNAYKMAQQLEAALVSKLGKLNIKSMSDGLNRAEVIIQHGLNKIYLSVNDSGETPYVYASIDSDNASIDRSTNYPKGSTELPSEAIQSLVDNVEQAIKKITPDKIDITDLPEAGSRSQEVDGKYGSDLSLVIRTAINDAVKSRFSYPAKSFKISVTKGSSLSSVHVDLKGVPKELKVYSNEFLALNTDSYEEQRRLGDARYTVDFNAVSAVIESAVNQFLERGEYDPYADYGAPVNIYTNFRYSVLDSLLEKEQNDFNNSLVDDIEEAKEEVIAEVNNGEGKNYDGSMDYKAIAKAVRKAIAEKAKDSSTHLFGGKYSVTSGLSTNKPFVAVTIKQVAQTASLIDTKNSIEELLRSYNKVTGSSIDDDVFMKFIPKVEFDVKAAKLFWYGLRARPIMVGTVPSQQFEKTISKAEAQKLFSDVHENLVRHGAIAYAQPLSSDDVSKYELVDLSKQADDEVLQNDFVKEARKLGAKIELVKGRYMALLNKERVIADASDLDEIEAFLEQVEDWVKESQLSDESNLDQHWYGMVYRPLSIGVAHSKRDLVVKMLTKEEAIKAFPDANPVSLEHGAVAYSQKLTDAEVKSFEFADLSLDDGYNYDDEYLLTTDVAKNAIKLGATIALNKGLYTAQLGEQTFTASYEDQEQIVQLHDEIESWVESYSNPSTVDGGELLRAFTANVLHKAINQLGGIQVIDKPSGYDIRINDTLYSVSPDNTASIAEATELLENMLEQANKPAPKEWDNFTLPALPKIAIGAIPEHFKLVYNRADNTVKITSDKYKKLDITVEYAGAGEGDAYLTEPAESLGSFSNPKELNYALNYAVDLTVKHHHNGNYSALDVNDTSEQSEEQEVRTPKDYGEFTPYQDDEGNWLVNDEGSIESFRTLEDAEIHARFALKVQESSLKAKAENEKLKAEIEAFNDEYSRDNLSPDDDVEESIQAFDQRVQRLSKKKEFRGSTNTIKGHVDDLLGGMFKVAKESVIDTNALNKAKAKMADLEATGKLKFSLSNESYDYDRLKNLVSDPEGNYSRDQYSLVSLDGQEVVGEKELGKTAMQYVQALVEKGKFEVTGTTIEPTPEIAPEPEQQESNAIASLKVALTQESDPDKLIEVLEAAMNEVESTDQIDEYEPLLEQASERVTELLEQQ